MSDDLVQFLRARYGEDERAARRVESSWRQIGDTGVIVASDGERAEECANGNWTGIAEHIVRHDPARVLREVEAKRQLVDHVAYELDDSGADNPWWYADRLTPILKSLALPYADHPDCRNTWRP